MDKININNLFPNQNNDFKPLDVYSLYGSKDAKLTNQVTFSIDNLLNKNKLKRLKVYKEYHKIYRMCLTKVSIAINMDLLNICYQIPENAIGYNNYDKNDCLNYLQEKLKLMYMDTFVISDNTLFVSWEHVEDNKKNIRENEITKI